MRRGEPQDWERQRAVDTGCHIHPACLSCPLPECIHDSGVEGQRDREAERIRATQVQVLQGHQAGAEVVEIAAKVGISTRSVHRHLKTLNMYGAK